MSESWQDQCSTWQSRMAFLYGSQLMTDCKLILDVEDEEKLELNLHKMVLSSCSTEFFNMWFLSDTNNDDIIIRDVSKKALTAFVYYLYNENAELSLDIFWDVLKLAKLYKVKSLINFCGTYLTTKVYRLNFLSIFEKVKDEGFDDVENQCLYLWSCSSPIIYENPKFKSISHEILKKLIDFNDFPGTHLDVYKGLMNWTGYQCEIKNLDITPENRSSVLDNCFNSNFFNKMTNDEFKSIDDKELFLTRNERLDLYRNLNSRFENLQAGKLLLSEGRLRRTYAAKQCLVFFSVARPFILHGFYIFGTTGSSIEHIDYCLLEDRIFTAVELSKGGKNIIYDGTPKKYPILFDSPIWIREGINYCLQIPSLRECERYCATDYNWDDFLSFLCYDEKIIREFLVEEVICEN